MYIAYSTFYGTEFCRAHTLNEMYEKLRESGDINKVWSYKRVDGSEELEKQ